MKKIEPYSCTIPKTKKTDSVEYCLWVDKLGELYVQIIGNEASGTFSKCAFSVSKYASKIESGKALGKIEGYNLESEENEICKNNNNSAFVKVALQNLLLKQ
jgi:hypothetical protein